MQDISSSLEKRSPILIISLRRSGSTAIWKAFRQDNRITAYNEPFNPEIIKLTLPEYRKKKYYKEFERLVMNPIEYIDFWEMYSPIHNIYELRNNFTDGQVSYLNYLRNTSNIVLLEMTRVHFKLEHLAEIFPQSFIIHLYRPAAAFATSIMLPSAGRLRDIEDNKVKYIYMLARLMLSSKLRKNKFWTTTSISNAWGFDELIGGSEFSYFSSILEKYGIDSGEIYKSPMVKKLLAYWKVCFETAQNDIKKYFNGRSYTLDFSEFCAQPEAILKSIYRCAGLSYTERNLDWVHPHNQAYLPNHGLWEKWGNELGIGVELHGKRM